MPLIDLLRERILNGLHMGVLRPGDRLASIRQTARETGVDHRAVALAFRGLESEGLIRVRGRSGVCVAEGAAGVGAAPLREDAREWMVEMLAGAWDRRMAGEALRALVAACADATGLRCACVESNEDQMVAYCAELATLSGLSVIPVHVDPNLRGPVRDPAERRRLRALLQDAQLVVTTHYHAVAVRSLLDQRETPLVLIRIDPELAAGVRSHLRQGKLTVVAATREFGARLRLMYADAISGPGRLRLVLADNPEALRRLDLAEPVLVTQAARERGTVPPDQRLLFPHARIIAPETFREITTTIVRLKLDALAPMAARMADAS